MSAAWAPPRSTRGQARDHRRVAIAARARARVERRALLVLAATDADRPLPAPDQVARWDRLVVEADELYIRLAGMTEDDAALRRAWRVAA